MLLSFHYIQNEKEYTRKNTRERIHKKEYTRKKKEEKFILNMILEKKIKNNKK